MSNLAQRLITAFVAIPVVFFLLWFCDYSRIGLMCFLAGVGAWEWAGMASKMYKGPDTRYLSFASSLALTLAWALSKGDYFGLPAVPYVVGMTFLVIFAIYIAVAYAKVEIDHLFPWLVMQLGAPLYIGLWGGMNVLMMGNGQGFEHCYPFILVMTSMWLCDTVAYFFGKFAAGKGPFGRHPFAPSISPKKTWEGCIGGTVFCALSVLVYSCLVLYRVEAIQMSMVVYGIIMFFLGILISIMSQLGDWFCSVIKRRTGIKDFGNIFPGHGGMMDRFDSAFFTLPTALLLAIIANNLF